MTFFSILDSFEQGPKYMRNKWYDKVSCWLNRKLKFCTNAINSTGNNVGKTGLKENNSLNHGLDWEKVLAHGYTEHKQLLIAINST